MHPNDHAHPANQSARDCDVLVVGGGPAGSTVSGLLTKECLRVVMTEKARHPRFHIGESLLPAHAALLDALGKREAVDRIDMRRWGETRCWPTRSGPSARTPCTSGPQC